MQEDARLARAASLIIAVQYGTDTVTHMGCTYAERQMEVMGFQTIKMGEVEAQTMRDIDIRIKLGTIGMRTQITTIKERIKPGIKKKRNNQAGSLQSLSVR